MWKTDAKKYNGIKYCNQNKISIFYITTFAKKHLFWNSRDSKEWEAETK